MEHGVGHLDDGVAQAWLTCKINLTETKISLAAKILRILLECLHMVTTAS